MKFLKLMLLSVLALVLGAATSFAQNIEGAWFNEEKDAKIEIFKDKNNKYFGKIVWLKEPNRDGKPKVDFRNPKKDLQTQPIMGLLLLRGFKKKSNDSYTDGTIYDPKTGKTYDCNITVKDANTLSIRGYVGISLLGKTTIWTKAN